jgi:hypothetical protein
MPQFDEKADIKRQNLIERWNRRVNDGVGNNDVDRPQGEWVPFEYGDERWHKCTACGVADRYIEYVERPNGTTGKLVAIRNYCPNCGADMRGDNDE